MWRIWGERCLVGLAAVSVLGVSMLIIWLLVQYLSYGNRGEEVAVNAGYETMAGAETQKEHVEVRDLDETEQVIIKGLGEKKRIIEDEGEKADENQNAGGSIRVRILGNSYQEPYHQSIFVTSEQPLFVEAIQNTDDAAEKDSETSESETQKSDEATKWQDKVTKSPEGDCFQLELTASELSTDERLCIFTQEKNGILTLPELIRAANPPQYRGRLFLYRKEEGILLVNELPLEQYLPGVVASEMPSDYPMQAQMAQAVCARTYAYHCMLPARNTDAVYDLDDSTSYQVYNNYPEDVTSAGAVEATEGELLACNEVLYYSTSCGINGRENLSKESAFRAFLAQEPEEDLEYGSPWVRWSVRITKEELLLQAQQIGAFSGSTLEAVTVQARRNDGQVEEMRLSGGGRELLITGEYEIRRMLAPGADGVVLHDGKKAAITGMLPSAWFWVEASGDAFLFHGGGYGHGKGMSQCGAASMAASGADYREILKHYYGESELLHAEDF